MTARHTKPTPFSAIRCYQCDECGEYFPLGGWQREYDWQEHVAGHARWRAVRVAVAEWAALPVLALLGLWVALTGESRHEWTGRLAVVLCVAFPCFVGIVTALMAPLFRNPLEREFVIGTVIGTIIALGFVLMMFAREVR